MQFYANWNEYGIYNINLYIFLNFTLEVLIIRDFYFLFLLLYLFLL